MADRASQVRVVCVAGARPNFVKVAPLLRALRARPVFDARLVHTGQHRDPALSSVFIEELGIPPPDAQLGITSGSHARQTAEIMTAFEDVLTIMQPQVVMVVGDVDSTLACALACAKFSLRKPFTTARSEQRRRPLLAHVEAGLRSFDDDMPEEVNRRITDALSDLLCVSDPAGLANLQKEGIPDDRIVFAGNVVIDSLNAARDLAGRSPVLDDLGLQGAAYGVVTLHRPGNVDDPVVLQRILRALDGVARELPLVFPVHPRTRERLPAGQGEQGEHAEQVKLEAPRWRLIEPLGYAAFLRLLGGARVAFTDSGGVQE